MTLPVIAAGAFAQVVLPFMFFASIALVVLFALPFRDVPFLAHRANAPVGVLRTIVLLGALTNLFLPGYPIAATLGTRWLLVAFAAVIAFGISCLDLRQAFEG